MIRALLSLFLPLLLLLPLANAQPLPDRFPISGVTVDDVGRPLSGAIITLRRQDETGAYAFWGAQTASDARGAFSFPLAETGRYYLSAESEGFAPLSNQVVVWKGGDRALRLRFERLVTLRLQVFAPSAVPDAPSAGDFGASPLANALVWVRLRGDGGAGQTSRRALTDGTGNLVLDGLFPAKYSVYLNTPRGFSSRNGVLLRHDTSLSVQLQEGGTLNLSVAQVGAPQGESPRALGGATLNLLAADPAELTRLMGDLADPGENFAALAAGGDMSALISRDGDGKIEISNLPPGNYLAHLRLPSYTVSQAQPVTIRAGQSSSAAFEATSNTGGIASLTLDLRFKAGEEASSATAAGDATKTRAASGEFTLRLLPIDAQGAPTSDDSPDALAFWPGGSAARRAVADKEGKITIFPLKMGRYRVFVAPRLSDQQNVENPNPPEAVSIDIEVPATGASGTVVMPDSATENLNGGPQ